MAFIKSVVKLILKEYPRYEYSGPVLALGVPEIYASREELQEWTQAYAGKPFPTIDADWTRTTNPVGKKLGWVSARYFFEGLGLDQVTYADIPGSEHAAEFVHDLNLPFPDDRKNRYGLVMDPGTIEHVFDMRTCLSNVVSSLRLGGVVVHQVPVYMFNGGYYSINPNLLNDFYSRNGFTDIETYIVMWDRYHPYTGKSRCYKYTDASMGGRHALADFDQVRYSPMMLFFARKEREVSQIASPLQFDGQYHPDARREETAPVEPPPSASAAARVRRAIRGAVGLLPDDLADEVNGHLTRIGQLARTRKQSFWI